MTKKPTRIKHPQGYTGFVWRNFKRDKLAVAALFVIAIMFVVSYLAPVIANNKPLFIRMDEKSYFPAAAELFPFSLFLKYPELRAIDFSVLRDDSSINGLMPLVPYSPYETSLMELVDAPSLRHWMGTDDLGRDVCSRMIHGAGVSLKVGFVAVGIALIIGVVFGSIAGYYGGWIDVLISRFIEVVMCFPFFFLILAVIAFLPPSIYNVMIVIGITRWTSIARYARGEFLKIKEQEYTQAARAWSKRRKNNLPAHPSQFGRAGPGHGHVWNRECDPHRGGVEFSRTGYSAAVCELGWNSLDGKGVY